MAARLVLISFACAAGTDSVAFSQGPLWFTPQNLPVVPAVNVLASPTEEPVPAANSAPAAVAARHSLAAEASPSDLVLKVADAPEVGLAVVERITDRAPAAQDPNPLLNTQSMIGPLNSPERMFSRLDIDDGLREVAALASSGPRADSHDYLWMPTPYTWISPVFYHQPLYFEQPNLERYGLGRARVVQPLLSSVHFFGSIPLVPYKTLTHHPRERVYTLGQGRPGNCVPLQRGVILGTSSVGELARFWHPRSGY